MRKAIFTLAVILVMISCSKDEDIAQSFFVNTYYTYSEYPDYGTKIADNTYVALYADNGEGVDVSKVNSVDPRLYDMKGKELDLRYVSDSRSGINTFTEIPNGKYILFALYSPYTYVNFYTYRKINVNSDYNAITEKIVFDRSKNNGFQ